MLQRLEKEEDSSCEIASTFSSLQAEVEAKTRKLKKLFAKLQSVKQEMGDLHEEFCRDRVDLQHTQDVLTRFGYLEILFQLRYNFFHLAVLTDVQHNLYLYSAMCHFS